MATTQSKTKTKPSTTASYIAALSLEIVGSTGTPDGYFLVFPEGETRSGDGSGRPTECDSWRLDSISGRVLANALNARPNDMVVDYEHQTLHKEKNGQPAPAAGWLASGQFEYVDGVGLCNRAPSWTSRATTAIAGREYRYKSPVIGYNLDGTVTNVLNVAITNQPALLSLDELTALSALHTSQNPINQQQDNSMKPLLTYVIAALGLATDTTEQAATDALSAEIDTFKTKATEAKIAINSDMPLAALSSIITATTTPDPAKYVPIATMTESMAALNAQITTLQGNQVNPNEALLTAALSDGRLLPAQEGWAKAYAESDPTGFASYLESAPRITALSQKQTNGVAAPITERGDSKITALSSEQKQVSDAMGLSEADMIAQLNA